MATVRNVIAIELLRTRRDGAEYCEKEWIRDPWISRIVAKVEERETIGEAAPPLLPTEIPDFDWPQVRRRP